MTVGEMLSRVTSSELTEWAAYERVHGPLGQTRDDYHTALILAMLHNLWAKKSKPLADFIIEWDRKPESAESLIAKGKAWVQMMGGSK